MNEVRVRFPNESVDQHLTTPIPFDWEEFKVENIHSEVVFGWWGDTYVSIPKEDYNNRYSDGYKEMGNEFYK